MNWNNYLCKSQSHNGTWGDHVILQALANSLNITITLITSAVEEKDAIVYVPPFHSLSFFSFSLFLFHFLLLSLSLSLIFFSISLEISPQEDAGHTSTPSRSIWLSYVGSVHYNSLYPSRDIHRRTKDESRCLIQ